MPEWVQNLLSYGVLSTIAVFILKKYYISRVKFEFDKQLENLKPLTAEETLRRENYLNSKRDAYYESIELLCKLLQSAECSGPDVPKDRKVIKIDISEHTINSCYAKLVLYSDNNQIPTVFRDSFSSCSPQMLGKYINLVKKDLGYGNATIVPEKYSYIFTNTAKIPTEQQLF
jgi:hypothetical protein